MTQAVIFDLDGLLVDSEPSWRRAHQVVLGRRGFTVTEDDVRHMAGKGTLVIVELWRERFHGWNAQDNEQVCQEIFEEVAADTMRNGTALPGAQELVKKLFDQHIPMAVASSSPLFLIKTTLEKLGIAEFIPILHSGVDEAHPKPGPDVYLSAARSLGVAPGECLVFEDSPTGIASAKAAGMRCIAVPEPGRDAALFYQADSIIPTLQDFDLATQWSQ